MDLWIAVVLLIVCLSGGFFAMRKWSGTRKRGFLALCIALYAASAVFALYAAMTFLLIDAIR